MGLNPGTKLGPYEIQSPLGAGGMGEVYRARDVRLDRTVAIKILPSDFSSDSGRRARFEREARTLSGLSHPNICALFDIGDQDGIQYVVLEYLEGHTIAERLAKGPLPIPEVLKVGGDIASALETAHRNGIVHRDLKPANVILTKTGAKLLDFGLAKPSSVMAPAALADAPTLTKSLTEEGTIVGTFRYMAPEQLEGRDADTRTDIFALGALLYEMCTGHPAFNGSSRASLIAAIMSAEPKPISSLQPVSSPALERVVQTCLVKDPEERCQTVHDVRLQLEWILDAGSQAGVPPVQDRRRIAWERIAWATAMLLLLAIAVLSAVRGFRKSLQEQQQIIFSVEPPSGYKSTEDGMTALSPDGTQVVYAAVDDKQKISLWVRSFSSLSARQLEGSVGADYDSVAWSTDSKAIVALSDGKLVRFSLTGGASEVLCDRFSALPLTMNREGTILTWTAPPTKIFSVSADDCTLRERSPSSGGAEVGYGYPYFLPDGNHFLFAEIHHDKHHEILIGSLRDRKTRVLIRNGSFPKYVGAGYLLFSRDGYLMAQKFDVKSETVSGDPILVYPNQLSFYAAFGWAAFDASNNGLISGHEQHLVLRQLRWFDRSGRPTKTIGEPEYVESPRLDVRSSHVLVSSSNPRTHASDLWSIDVKTGVRHRESFRDRPGNQGGLYTPDGRRILYSTLQGSVCEMFIKDAGSGINGEGVQTSLSGSKVVADVSPDGNSILYQYEPAAGPMTTYGQSLIEGKPFPVGPAVEGDLPRLSPDGKWVALPSDESGSVEIVVRPFSSVASGDGTQVSLGGGHDPRWSNDGRELFYRTSDWHIVSVPVLDLSKHRFGKPATLFRLLEGSEYDVVDSKRFLVSEPIEQSSGFSFVIANWKPALATSN